MSLVCRENHHKLVSLASRFYSTGSTLALYLGYGFYARVGRYVPVWSDRTLNRILFHDNLNSISTETLTPSSELIFRKWKTIPVDVGRSSNQKLMIPHQLRILPNGTSTRLAFQCLRRPARHSPELAARDCLRSIYIYKW